MLLSTLLFWSSVAVVLYAYVGFVVVLVCCAWIRRRRVQKAPITPSITLLITAYNEERCIAGKLINSLSLDYPAGALEIIVASDGSDDRTNFIVQEYAQSGVRLLALPRKGKMISLDIAA